jgi:hypothetical protein
METTIWTGKFSGTGRDEVLFYYNGDGNWWLGSLTGVMLTWKLVNNSKGFGNLLDGHHATWIGDFTASGHDQVLFYYSGDGNWWLGTFTAGNLGWTLSNNSAGFGNLLDGNHWLRTGKFSGTKSTEMLFYYSGDGNWWLGSLAGTALSWKLVDNSAGFGNLLDGKHPMWAAPFSGGGRTEVLFYFSGDGNWWLGVYEPVNGQPATLSWVHNDNTSGFGGAPNFGNLADGRHMFLTGDFTASGRTQVLFYFNGDGNWWLRGFPKTAYHIVQLDMNAGAVVSDARVFDRGASGRPSFEPGFQDQRGGLNLVGRWVYAWRSLGTRRRRSSLRRNPVRRNG